jgi:hypothetical protein
MKKINLFILLSLFTTSFVFGQSQPITLNLSQPTVPTSFTLNANNVWAETCNDVDYPFIEFNNSAFKCTHLGAGEGNSWGGAYWDGFTYSKNGDNTDYGTNWFSNSWGNMAGGGIKTDAAGNVLKDDNGVVLTDLNVPYLLAYWGLEGYSVPVLSVFFDNVYQAEGVYVNISPWAYFGNIHGDGFARALNQNGDYLKLFIHGLDENHQDNGQKVEYYLAKFENGVLTQSPNWEWIDLSGLGGVAGIYFTMESTDNSSYGMNTAAYFCIDKIQIRVPEQIISVIGVELNKTELTLTINETETLIATVLPKNATNKGVTWTSSNPSVATVNSGTVTAIAEGETTITVTTDDGNFSDVCTVTVTSVGIGELQAYKLQVYPNPTAGELAIRYEILDMRYETLDVQIFDVYGRNVLPHTTYHTPHTTLNISHLPAGIYFVTIQTEKGTVIKKVIKE